MVGKLEQLKFSDDINQQMVKVNGPKLISVFQAKQMADLKKQQGWSSTYLKFSDAESSYIFLVLTKKVPMLGRLAYIPKGLNLSSVELSQLLQQLKIWAAGRGIFLLKIEPEISQNEALKLKDESSLNLHKSHNIQTNSSTIIIDLSPTEEDLINSFKQKTRYNIRLAERKGVKVKAVEPTEQNLNIMFKMMQQMSARSGAHIKPKSYLFGYWRAFIDAGDGALFFASDETGQVLAGAFVQFLGGQALYKDGGSTREKSNLMAPYLLQWEIMSWLKLKGVTLYDMHGSTPSGKQDDQSHQYYSVTKFKQGFNKNITDWPGVWDLPINQNRWRIWLKFSKIYFKFYYFTHGKQGFF